MKLKLLLSLFLALSFNSIINAQFETKFSLDAGGDADDGLRKITALKGSGVFVGGQSKSNSSESKTENCRGGYDYWVIKFSYSKNGGVKKLWDKTVGGDKDEYLQNIIATKDGGCLLCGTSYSGISGDKTDTASRYGNIWLVKLDYSGKIQWQKTVYNIKADINLTSIEQTNDGGYISATGYGLTKLNEHGDIVWQRTTDSGHFYSSVKQTTDGGYILADSYGSGNGITKTNSTGDVEWYKNLGYEGSDYINNRAIQTSDGGYALYGVLVEEDDLGPFAQYRRLYKTDVTGKASWIVNDYFFNGFGFNAGLAETADGSFIFSSSEWDYPNPYVYNVEKIDKNGKILWNKNAPENSDDGLQDMIEVAPDNYMLGGSSNFYNSDDEVYQSDYYFTIITDTSNLNFAIAGSVNNNLNNNKSNFKAYPNPVKNILYIQSQGKNTFILSDQSGKIWLKTSVNNTGELNISKLHEGIYYLKNVNNSNTQKIIITK